MIINIKYMIKLTQKMIKIKYKEAIYTSNLIFYKIPY